MNPNSKIAMILLEKPLMNKVFDLFDNFFHLLSDSSIDNSIQETVTPLNHVIDVLKDAYQQKGITESDLMDTIFNLLNTTDEKLKNSNSNDNSSSDVRSSFMKLTDSFLELKDLSEKIIVKISLPSNTTENDLLSLKPIFGEKTLFVTSTGTSIDKVIQYLDRLDAQVIVVTSFDDMKASEQKHNEFNRNVKILEEKVGNSIECNFSKHEPGNLSVRGLCNVAINHPLRKNGNNIDFCVRGVIDPVFNKVVNVDLQPESKVVQEIINILKNPKQFSPKNYGKSYDMLLVLDEPYRALLLTRYNLILRWTQALEKLFPQRIPSPPVEKAPSFSFIVDSRIKEEISKLFEIQMGFHQTFFTLKNSFENSRSNAEAVEKVLNVARQGHIGFDNPQKQAKLIQTLESILIDAQQLDVRNNNNNSNQNANSNVNDNVSIKQLNAGGGMFGYADKKLESTMGQGSQFTSFTSPSNNGGK